MSSRPITELIDTERYPINASPSSDAYQQLVAQCKARLEAVGSIDLQGFIRPEVIRQ